MIVCGPLPGVAVVLSRAASCSAPLWWLRSSRIRLRSDDPAYLRKRRAYLHRKNSISVIFILAWRFQTYSKQQWIDLFARRAGYHLVYGGVVRASGLGSKRRLAPAQGVNNGRAQHMSAITSPTPRKKRRKLCEAWEVWGFCLVARPASNYQALIFTSAS